MSFITAVAGPSRLPYGAQAARTCAAAAHGAQRGYAAPARRSREGEGEVDVWTAKPIEGAGPAGKTRESKPEDFIGWLRKVGWEYRRPEPGQRARWLGKHVPYATNPSFRPPPPLSNDMMIKLDAELRSGKRTIGQISQAYSISKHRLDAIRKLKEVEEEFVRQNVPLQRAFQKNMETLLGSKSPNDRNSSATVEAARNEQLARTSHRSTTVELEEEHDASEKPGTGAFGVQGADESITKDVWKLTDESTYLATQKAEAEERAARKAAELAEIASGTDADSLHAGEADAVIPSTTKRVARTAYRFVDTSSVASAPKSKK